MKRFAALLVLSVALLLPFSFAGCAKEITGNCSSVISQCQSLTANEKPAVTVTGTPVTMSDTSGKLIMLSDSGETGGGLVWVNLKDNSATISGRTTFKGTLDPTFTKTDSVTLVDSVVVK